MPGNKPNHGLLLWFPIKLQDGETGLRFNDDPDLTLSSVAQCLIFVYGWVHHGSTVVVFS